MKLAIAKEHRDFFQKQGFIEFEDFLSQNDLILFDRAINQALSQRIKTFQEKGEQVASEQLFLRGRDLWRSDEELRTLVCQSRFARIVSELIEKKPLRLGYDQLFPSLYPTSLRKASSSIYTGFIQQTTTLNEISCLQGIVCGLMLALFASNPENQEMGQVKESEGVDIFPHRPGQVIFFQPHIPINLTYLYQHSGQRFLLIVYTQSLACYQLQVQDPHTHFLKHLGYIFNDRLSDKLNPIVYR